MSFVNRVRKKAKKSASAMVATSGLALPVYRAVFRRTLASARTREPAQERRWHLLVAPPGGGNIGDQAMVEAFLENTTGPVRVIVRTADDIRIPPAQLHRARLEPIRSLIYGDGIDHLRAIAEFSRLLESSVSLTVVGADIMDGAYNVSASVRRADVATLARDVGVDARILGFSWNGRAHPGALRALARAGRAGTSLLLRDPVSAGRARQDGLENVVDAADVVFAARTSSASAVDEFLGERASGEYAVVNASGLVARSMDQVAEYSTVVRALLDADITVVLLPHVIRSSANDAIACLAIQERVGDDRVIFIDRLLEPAEVRGLCAGARLVLTGRMHLAIQAMWSSVPAIALSTQGKVEGLMALFGSEELCVQPGDGLAARVVPIVTDILADRDAYGATIAENLLRVRELADRNFNGLI